MKTSCQTVLLAATLLAGCGRVGYDGGGIDGGDEPLTDGDTRRDATERTDARDSGAKRADGRADTGKERDAATDTGKGDDGATDTGVDDAVTEAAPRDAGDAASEATAGDGGGAGDARGSDAEAGVDASVTCVGAYVCGDGADGTTLNTSYACTGGKIATSGVACAFGCDSSTGKCADLVPANAAASHLPASSPFTCLSTQTSSVPSISGGPGDVIAFDTGTAGVPSVTKNQTAIALPWGAPYTPTLGGTSVIVAHLGGFSVTSGALVTIVGPNALILLVDGDVSINGSTTVVDLSAHYSSGANPSPQFGPGASTAGHGGVSTLTNQGGGGGAGHGVAGGSGGPGGSATMTVIPGGLAYGSLFVLEAGSIGGGLNTDSAGKGGGGLQISACGNINVTDALINGSGGGGMGGPAAMTSGGSSPPGGGYGGGSGGTIILEGATANSLAGSLVANGGGGGQGASGNTTAGANGSDWTRVYDTLASGGAGGGAVGLHGSGGAGGAGTTPPVNGMPGGVGNGGGGGGGAYGAIYIGVSPATSLPSATGASPPAYYAHTCTTVGGVPPATCPYL